MTKKELYNRNQKRAKFLSNSAPFVFWGFLILGFLFLILALKNSFGNLDEITSLLNSKVYNGEELQANYSYLVDKYGEWVIGNGNNGFQLMFIDIKNAIFGAVVIVMAVLSAVSFILAFLLGKWIFPALAKEITQGNQDMVNLTILEKEE